MIYLTFIMFFCSCAFAAGYELIPSSLISSHLSSAISQCHLPEVASKIHPFTRRGPLNVPGENSLFLESSPIIAKLTTLFAMKHCNVLVAHLRKCKHPQVQDFLASKDIFSAWKTHSLLLNALEYSIQKGKKSDATAPDQQEAKQSAAILQDRINLDLLFLSITDFTSTVYLLMNKEPLCVALSLTCSQGCTSYAMNKKNCFSLPELTHNMSALRDTPLPSEIPGITFSKTVGYLWGPNEASRFCTHKGVLLPSFALTTYIGNMPITAVGIWLTNPNTSQAMPISMDTNPEKGFFSDLKFIDQCKKFNIEFGSVSRQKTKEVSASTHTTISRLSHDRMARLVQKNLLQQSISSAMQSQTDLFAYICMLTTEEKLSFFEKNTELYVSCDQRFCSFPATHILSLPSQIPSLKKQLLDRNFFVLTHQRKTLLSFQRGLLADFDLQSCLKADKADKAEIIAQIKSLCDEDFACFFSGDTSFLSKRKFRLQALPFSIALAKLTIGGGQGRLQCTCADHKDIDVCPLHPVSKRETLLPYFDTTEESSFKCAPTLFEQISESLLHATQKKPFVKKKFVSIWQEDITIPSLGIIEEEDSVSFLITVPSTKPFLPRAATQVLAQLHEAF